MPAASWTAIAFFAFVSSITPGPNNLLATASGARFGFRRTLPQVAGVTSGFTILLWLAASGIAALIIRHPTIALILSIAGFGYLLWLSFQLFAAAIKPSMIRETLQKDRPMRFWEAALFQFANPKAWMMALSAASSFLANDPSIPAVVSLGLLFAAINFPCVGAWAAMGAHLQRWLHDPLAAWRLRLFNATMGMTLFATTAYMAATR